MMQSTPEGVIFTVRVITRAAKSGLSGQRENSLVVRLHAPPVDGAANAELIRVLAETFDVPARAVSIVSGEHSRQKRVRIAGLDAGTATARLGLHC